MGICGFRNICDITTSNRSIIPCFVIFAFGIALRVNLTFKQVDSPGSPILMGALIPLISATGPMLLWLVELYAPYPFIVEEVFKGIIVYLILKEKAAHQEKLVIISALLFSISENFLYIFNFSMVGNINIFLLRLVLTTFMHTATFLIIYQAGRRNIAWLPIGVILGGLVHYFYNELISNFF